MNLSIVTATTVALLTIASSVRAGNCFSPDTIYSHFNLDEVAISSSVKQIGKLETADVSSTSIVIGSAQQAEVRSLKSISGQAPNFFMPDYGSSLTSAIYIRGIGSRINTPAVGMYIDDMPYIDKSAFSFNFADIRKIEVLRGPQCTLYGRNAMGGLIHIYTHSPFTNPRTEVAVAYTGKTNGFNVSIAHRGKLSDRMALSAEGFYNCSDGFFYNKALDRHSDFTKQIGGKARLMWLPADMTKADFTTSYEHTDEGGYAYEYLGVAEGEETYPQWRGEINSNRMSGYWRSLFNAGAKVEHQFDHLTLNAMTSFQLLNDKMSLDQDFLPTDTFELDQAQRQRTITQELTLKNRAPLSFMNMRWVTGMFAYHQWVDIDSPVRFNSGGVEMIQTAMDNAMHEAGSPVTVTIDKNGFEIGGLFATPAQGIALYGNMELFPSDKWELSAGVRFDYEQLQLDYNTGARIKCNILMDGSNMEAFLPVEYIGDDANNYLNILPKISARYLIDNDNVIYATISKGYRSGGFNVQRFSDVVSTSFRGKPGSIVITRDDISAAVSYDPEVCWNYEIGTHLKLSESLRFDASLFAMQTTNQQVARFAPNGLGREVVNAGKCRSLGIETALQWHIINNRLTFNANYGLTDSKFTDYEGEDNYNNNYVPFVPRHTLAVSLSGVIVNNGSLLKRLTAELTTNYTGEIYWLENNSAKQNGYLLLNANICATLPHVTLVIWGKNLNNRVYDTFYFESMNHRFAQRGKPSHIGIEARVRF
jgi:outer membrane receptor protein involved in Fe transport